MIDREMILDLIDNSGCALDPDFQMQKAQALALVRIGDLLEKLVPTEDATKMTMVAYPEIMAFQKVGEPSVTIRNI